MRGVLFFVAKFKDRSPHRFTLNFRPAGQKLRVEEKGPMAMQLRKNSCTERMLCRVVDKTKDGICFDFIPRSELLTSKDHKTYWREHTALQRLERMGYLEVGCVDTETGFRLAFKGLQESIRLAIGSTARALPDGLALYVSYDIPETLRFLRKEIRLFLQSAGFHRVHQSLWSIGKDVRQDLEDLFELREDIEFEWIKVYLGMKPFTPGD